MDDGDEVHVMRILISDLPEALTLDHIKEGVALGPTYQKLVTAIDRARRTKTGTSDLTTRFGGNSFLWMV